jgi:hypothetical protein
VFLEVWQVKELRAQFSDVWQLQELEVRGLKLEVRSKRRGAWLIDWWLRVTRHVSIPVTFCQVCTDMLFE